MADSFLCVQTVSGVARLTLNRPEKRNALTRALLTDLLVQVRKAAADDAVRIVVLDSTGDVFCAGMDLAEMQEVALSPEPEEFWRQDSQLFCDVLSALFEAPKPVVCVAQGPVLAGGVGLMLACDMVLAAETARFSLPEPRRGITASIVTPLLAYRVGAARASALLLSGESFSAARALDSGLCHDVVPAEKLHERTEALTASILTGSPMALAESKRQLIDSAGAEITAQLQRAVEASAVARGTDDAREGLAAFLEKRSPNWQPEA